MSVETSPLSALFPLKDSLLDGATGWNDISMDGLLRQPVLDSFYLVMILTIKILSFGAIWAVQANLISTIDSKSKRPV